MRVIRSRPRLLSALAAVAVHSAACAIAPAATPAAPAGPASPAVDFNRDVQPILSENCYSCHGPDAERRKAKLRFDTQKGALAELKGGGYAIVPGHPEQSELIARVNAADPDELMPPEKSHRVLSADQKQTLRRWVEQGAPWAKHWSLVAPVRPQLPAVKDEGWCRNPIDRFVLAKLEKEGLRPSPEAPKETLIRRVTLDLTGLPPTPAEVDAFVADSSPDAYEKVVDRLLASPRYGERMVWEWLDAARYADTNGYQDDRTRTMWPWRDWAIRAMNDNMPFDRFTIEQLAGDLVPNATVEDKLATGFCRNHMINGEGGRIPEENRVDYVMDQSETVGTVFLGLTVGCCRCHDHKFDPLSQKDYYSLFAFFNNTPVTGGGSSGQTEPILDLCTAEQKEQLKAADADVKKHSDELFEMEKRVFTFPQGKTLADSPRAKGLSGSVLRSLANKPESRYLPTFRNVVKQIDLSEPELAEYAGAVGRFLDVVDAREKLRNLSPRVMVMEEGKPRDAFILTKGAYDKPAEKVTADVPAALPPLPAGEKKDRLALAKWLVSAGHPLTARVTVNRYWQQFFGVGLVKTVEDFGVQGEKPVNPELLDWLAVQFRDGSGAGGSSRSTGVPPVAPSEEHGRDARAAGPGQGPWDVKALHRLIVTSAAYRQSSKVSGDLAERDPENRLLARGPRFRLPAFALRDQALAASGLLVEHVGGPPVKPYQPPGVWEEATFGLIPYEQDHGDALYRRSVYTFWRRIVGPPEFFDNAARQTCTVRQGRTDTPLHALTTLNDPTFVEAARALARRALTEGGTDPAGRIDLACRRILARRASGRERAVLLEALDRLKRRYAADPAAAAKLLAVGESKRDESLDPVEHAAYTGLCLAILNFDEALTKE